LVKGPSSRVKLNHPATNLLGSLNDNMSLKSKALNVITHSCYLSQFELKNVGEALQDADWLIPCMKNFTNLFGMMCGN